MTGNLLHMAVDSINEGEPLDVVVDRVIRLFERHRYSREPHRELHPVEKQVDLLRRHQDLEITPEEARQLLKSNYKAHYGLRRGMHWRHSKGAQAGYHLREKGGKSYLHWDKFDPRSHPIKHAFEVPLLRRAPVAGAALGALVGGVGGLAYHRFKRKAGWINALKKGGKWAGIGALGGLAATLATGIGVTAHKSRALRKRLVRERAMRGESLAEQVAGASGGSTGATGGAVSGGTATNGGTGDTSYGGSKMNGKNGNHHRGKLMGKGVVHSLHTAYAPDTCALKYPPATQSDAYYKCREKKDKVESHLDEIMQPIRRFIYVALYKLSVTELQLLGLWPFNMTSAEKLIKSLYLHRGAKVAAIIEDEPSEKSFIVVVKTRNAVKHVVNTLHDYIKDKLGSSQNVSSSPKASIQGAEKLLSTFTHGASEEEAWTSDFIWDYVREV